MAKAYRDKTWTKYLEKLSGDTGKKGTKLVQWGRITVDFDRIDTTIIKYLPSDNGGVMGIMAGNLGEKALLGLTEDIEKISTNEIEIYHAQPVGGTIIYIHWNKRPGFKKRARQGAVDFEGAAANAIIEKIEAMYTTLSSESVEEVRQRSSSGGFEYEHGDSGGTGTAAIVPGPHGAGATGQVYDTPQSAVAGSKNIRGLKAQKQVLSALDDAFTEIKAKGLFAYADYIEAAITDWAQCNLNIFHTLQKGRSIKGINEVWQGEGSITLGPKIIPNTTVPRNSRKVDNVIRKEFSLYMAPGGPFVKDVIKSVRHLPIKERLRVFKDSPDMDELFLKYGAGAFAAVFTKSGKLDRRYKINKKLLNNAKTDKGKSKGKTRRRSAGPIIASSRATASKTPSRGKTVAASPQSAINLKELLNAALPEYLLAKMQPPALQNRTGRFRNSVEVTEVKVGARGGTSIDYTYRLDPYKTFEPGGDMGSVNRDPRRLIGGSIRELAQQITGNKFITTRRR